MMEAGMKVEAECRQSEPGDWEAVVAARRNART
jgi:hypothetical protein